MSYTFLLVARLWPANRQSLSGWTGPFLLVSNIGYGLPVDNVGGVRIDLPFGLDADLKKRF